MQLLSIPEVLLETICTQSPSTDLFTPFHSRRVKTNLSHPFPPFFDMLTHPSLPPFSLVLRLIDLDLEVWPETEFKVGIYLFLFL